MNEPISDKELKEIEDRRNASTEGPWSWSDVKSGSAGDRGTSPDMDYIREHLPAFNQLSLGRPYAAIGDGKIVLDIDLDGHLPTQADAAFLAHSKADIQRLIGEIHRLRALVKK